MSESHEITRALLPAMMHSTQPMCLTDPAQEGHPMIAVNAAFEALTGYAATDVVGRNCRFLQGEDTLATAVARVGRCIRERRGCIEWLVNYRRDGSRFFNLLFMSPVFDREGRLLHFFGNQRDITLGLPDGIPGYDLGRADMPEEGQIQFQAMLMGLLAEEGGAGRSGAMRARELERIVEAARVLNEVTTRLVPAKWSPPAAE